MRTESLPAPGPSGPDQRWRGVLHDLGHGLAAVSYLADGMRGDPALSDPARARLDLMRRELQRLLVLVTDEADAGEPEPVDVRGVLQEVAAARARPEAAAILVRPGGRVQVRAEPIRLWRMVSNLVDNAVCAAGPGGEVELAAEAGRGEAVVEIVDDGPGFGRGPAADASLGLSVVRGLAGGCGAQLRLERMPQRGTRARLVFPAD